jgi:hypothetical protein
VDPSAAILAMSTQPDGVGIFPFAHSSGTGMGLHCGSSAR